MSAIKALDQLGLCVWQRDWLSSNQIFFPATGTHTSVLVDSGHARGAALTLALVERALGPRPLGWLCNTHLHSDHCGGNAALLSTYPGLRISVPAGYEHVLTEWMAPHTSHQMTGQTCPPFVADDLLRPGMHCKWGSALWEVYSCPGHDQDAVMFWEPQSRTLIAGDALWEDRLAIIFPELTGGSGFGEALATLSLIERLNPRQVIPGHGPVFEDVDSAIARSRERIQAFILHPDRHRRHAARALLMFHIMEEQGIDRHQLLTWLEHTPLFRRIALDAGCTTPSSASRWAWSLVEDLLSAGHLLLEPAGRVVLSPTT